MGPGYKQIEFPELALFTAGTMEIFPTSQIQAIMKPGRFPNLQNRAGGEYACPTLCSVFRGHDLLHQATSYA